MVAGFIALVCLVAIFVVYAAAEARHSSLMLIQENAKKRAAAIRATLGMMEGCTSSQTWLSTDLMAAIGVDETTRMIGLVDGRDTQLQGFVFHPSDLLDVALVEDGHTITETRTDRGSQLAGVLIGGALGGLTGEVIGGLSARRVSTGHQIVSSLELRVTVNDTKRPVWRIAFISVPTQQGSPTHKARKNDALQWQGLLSVLIKQADKAAAIAPPTQPALPFNANSEITYHVCRAGKDIGPMTVVRIRELAKAGKLSMTDDMYFDPQLDEWTNLELLPS